MLITSSMFGKQLFQMLHHSCFSLLLTYLCDYYKIMMLDSCPEVSHEKAHWCPPDFVLMLLDPADCIWIFHIFFWDQHTRHIRLCCICCSYVSYAKYSHYKFIFSTHTGFVNVSLAKSTRTPVMYLTLSFHCFTEHNPQNDRI